MSQVSDKEIIEWIKRKSYSSLAFLDDCWVSSENEWYLGFYYFVLDLKQEDHKKVFDEIISRHGSESSAYLYLGKTAQKIFSSFGGLHIAASFYRKSIELNKENSEAYWGLFSINGDMAYCLKSLNFDYENKKTNQLQNKLDNILYLLRDESTLSHEDWQLVKKIVSDGEASRNQNIILSMYFNLGDVEGALAMIASMDYVDVKIIQPYFDQGLISKSEALSKLHFFQISTFLGEDYKRIYQECLKEFKKGDANPTRMLLIRDAFNAGEFNDVIAHYNESPADEDFFAESLKSRLYYLVSQYVLKQTINEEVLNYVHKRIDSLENEEISLYQVVKCKQEIKKIKDCLAQEYQSALPIEYLKYYQDAIKNLDHPDLQKHFPQLYDQLVDELKCLKKKYDDSYHHNQLFNAKSKMLTDGMSSDALLEVCNSAIDAVEYEYAIEHILEFQKKNALTMTLYNCLGVCYERKGDFVIAVDQYKHALDLMRTSKERNDIIISNYVSCVKKLPDMKLSENEFDKLKEEYNTALIEKFMWETFTAKNRHSLFKYSPFNINAIDALTNKYFYLAGKNQLNDPIELPELKSIGKDDDLIDSNYRICSFSNNEGSMLMWSHYAQEHQGIMVEYWFGGEFPVDVGIGKVRYTNEIKRTKEKELYIFNQYILTKNEEWAYEDEVRLFSNKSDKVSFDDFDYPNHDRNKINARISSITLGYKFPEDKKKLIFKLVATMNSNKASHEELIIIKEAFMPDGENFSLAYREIDIDDYKRY